MGIDEIFLQDGLFVPFRKVDTFSEGAGLGISIAQHILNLMEGSIKVQSSLGEGWFLYFSRFVCGVC